MSGPALADAEPLTFGITVPHSWFELDLRPQSRDAAIQTLVHERLRDVPALWEQRAAVVRLLRREAREAWQSGARYCACLVMPTDDGPVTASVTVSVVRAPAPDDPAGPPGPEASVQQLLARLRPRERVEGEDLWTRVDTVDVPGAGTAARSAGVEDVALPGAAGSVRVVQMQTLLPVRGTDKVLLVSCSSPVLPLADALLDVFDAITATVRVGDPREGGI